MREKVFFDLKRLVRFNVKLGPPYAEKIEGRDFWELRTKVGGGIYRTFYFAQTGRKFVLLHAIRKKSQKTPKKELDVAEERMKDYLTRVGERKEEEMTAKREEDPGINPEVEEDGEAHLEEMLRRDEEFRRVWEANRARRELGMLVLERRQELGLSQRELAGRIGTSQNRIYLIENGEANPTLDTLQRLSGVLGLALEIRPGTLAVH